MSDDDIKIEKIAKAVKTVSEAVPVYEDAIQPAAKEVGKALKTTAQAINLALSPIRGLIWGYEQFEGFLNDKVSERLKYTPEDEIITPPANVVGPAMEALRFAGHSEELQNMYANLLASAMDSQTKMNASFDHYHMNENLLQAFEKIDLIGIPAVLIYDSNGSEQYRLTGDNPNKQFTEKDIEKAVNNLLK